MKINDISAVRRVSFTRQIEAEERLRDSGPEIDEVVMTKLIITSCRCHRR